MAERKTASPAATGDAGMHDSHQQNRKDAYSTQLMEVAMTDFIQTDDYQWLRKVGDHEYEMYQIMKAPEYVEREFWFAGGGEFKLEWYEDDIDYDINNFGYESVAEIKRIYGDHWERIVAECVFECNWADFDLESFDTLDEARAYVNKLMED